MNGMDELPRSCSARSSEAYRSSTKRARPANLTHPFGSDKPKPWFSQLGWGGSGAWHQSRVRTTRHRLRAPVICQTATFTPMVAVVARVDSWVSLEAAVSSLMGLTVNSALSADGGETWSILPDGFASVSNADLAGVWGHATSSTIFFPATGQRWNNRCEQRTLSSGRADHLQRCRGVDNQQLRVAGPCVEADSE